MKHRFKPKMFCSKSLSMAKFFFPSAVAKLMSVTKLPIAPKVPMKIFEDPMKYRNEIIEVSRFCKVSFDEMSMKFLATNDLIIDMTLLEITMSY